MQRQSQENPGEQKDSFRVSPPSLSLPKGGGAIRGIGEKFSANPVTGTGSMSVPIALSPGRGGFGPQLALSYDSGAGNGPFGLGWQLALPSISRKTDKGLPTYADAQESDVFLLSGAEDLVPVLVKGATSWSRQVPRPDSLGSVQYQVHAYRPRIEGLFASIERWVSADGVDTFWRTISRDNVTTYYGRTADSRVFDPANPAHIFNWLICETFDDRGNAVLYEYRRENRDGVDAGQAHERNRSAASVGAGTYIKRIRYGNTPSRLAAGYPAQVTWHFEAVFDYGEGHYSAAPANAEGRVFAVATTHAPAGSHWPVRADSFSSHRAGFEVRTYRLCRRVLMFHRFPELGVEPVLVKSTEFAYEELPAATFLESVTHCGYVAFAGRNGLYRKSLPPVTFRYSPSPSAGDLAALPIEAVSGDGLDNLPVGLGDGYQWVDLDGEGLSGVLAEREGAWYYKRNLGSGSFGPLEPVAAVPSIAARGSHQLLDLAGDGQLDVVVAEAQFSGFIERTRDNDWERFRSFESAPNISWRDPNVRFLDLTGDGLADLVVSEHEAFVWHRSLGEKGFASAQRTAKFLDEEKGPHLVFADGTQTLFLADMCGDGLTDLVRIRNGEVCYWPNQGYGRFGAKVSMDRAPWFDQPDLFDPGRIRLSDIDGTGPTDIVYLHGDGPVLYFNQSGNAWSAGRVLPQFPRTDNWSNVQVIDLLGRGTACLVWSSPLPGDTHRPLRYIDLMAGTKPHLLLQVDNNLGATTTLEYKSSTHFYLADRAAGTPWVTRLPFPVHVVTRVTVEDRWRQTKFSSTYSYHHGYFDGEEREFRGFGRVEQVDVETYDEFLAGNASSPVTDDRSLYQPPVKTITWHHTGAATDRDRILAAFENEYFNLPGFSEHRLPQPTLPADLTADEWQEAARACKGMTLRQEVFELDVDALEDGREVPVRVFSTAFHNCEIRCLQPRGDNRHAVFLVAESEVLTFHYEHDLRVSGTTPDPRIAHTLNLEIDQYGNVLESVAAAYPRIGVYTDSSLTPEQLALVREVQNGERHLALNCTRYTDDVIGNDVRRLRVPCQTRTWEVTGVTPTAGRYFTLNGLRAANLTADGTTEIPYHQTPNRTTPQRRLVECLRTLFFADDLMGARAFGETGALALPRESYKLALTRDLLQRVFTGTAHLPAALAALDEQANGWPVSGYRRGDSLFTDNPVSTAPLDQQYWTASGVAGFAADAAAHFYLPERYTDAFGNVTELEYDPLDLFVRSSRDAMGNESVVERFDYRVLAPLEMLDPNGNRNEVYFDALGLVVASAAKGKRLGNGWEGDDLEGFDAALANPPAADVQGFCTDSVLNLQQAKDWLGDATSRFVYHFGDATRMAGACGIVRERHAPQVARDPANENPIQVSLECSDGGGNVLMKKVRAEPDPVTRRARWIVNGLTVLNNKGKPVKQYEPAFSERFGCELPQANGVTTVLYYDAAGRVVRTEMPDGTFSRVEFSPWHVKTFDANDTVLEPQCSWYRQNGHNRFDPANTLPIPMGGAVAPTPDERAGWLAARHANTPAQVHLDSLGREVIAIAHNRVENATGQHTYDGRQWKDEFYLTFTRLDAEGKPLWIRDARGNLVMQYITPPKPTRWADQPNESVPAASTPCYDIAGNLLHQHSMDAGDRWMIMDAAGKPILAWDANEARDDAGGAIIAEQRVFRTRYDSLHRPVGQWLSINGGAPALIEAFDYCDIAGPSLPEGGSDLNTARQRNLIGQAIRHWDPSGRATVERLDFKGGVEEITRTLVADVKAAVVDWNLTDRVSLLDVDPRTQQPETFHQVTEYDALGRMTRLYNWHRGNGSRVAIYEPEYNERGALLKEKLTVRATKTATSADRPGARVSMAIEEVTYNAKGQKLSLTLGNGTTTTYSYDAETFRLMKLKTGRHQDLSYTYDPVGNITHLEDAAPETVYLNNSAIRPEHDYIYDAIYRLIEATGRENPNGSSPPPHPEGASPRGPVPTADMPRNYRQRYSYDAVGNFIEMRHLPDQGTGWTRHYTVQPDSNRLDQTWYNSTTAGAVTYRHDPHGNMLNLDRAAPGLDLRWDWRDMIRALDLQGGGDAFYNYGIDKQRTRKRIEHRTRSGAANPHAGTTEDRIYLGGYELYRRRNSSGAVVEEIESLHLFEGEQRVLLVDDVLTASGGRPDGLTVSSQTLWRYQYGNHLGSVGLELDDTARVISYEEFHPYGTSAYRLMNSAVEAPPRRYRYTGMERDEESGLGYHTARYYHCSLGYWISIDPSGANGGINLLQYCNSSPVRYGDRSGLQAEAYERASVLLDNVDTTLDHHGFFRGTFEGALAEAQGYVFLDKTGDVVSHAESLAQSANAAQNRLDEIGEFLTNLAKNDPDTYKKISPAFLDVQSTLRQHISRSNATLQAADELRRAFPDRLAPTVGQGAKTERTFGGLVSQNLSTQEVQLIPPGALHNAEELMSDIRKLPINEAAVEAGLKQGLKLRKISGEFAQEGARIAARAGREVLHAIPVITIPLQLADAKNDFNSNETTHGILNLIGLFVDPVDIGVAISDIGLAAAFFIQQFIEDIDNHNFKMKVDPQYRAIHEIKMRAEDSAIRRAALRID